ncbi:MAG TPA: glycosyltransferase family 4 protein [Thermoleophilaceae bacterium]|nr:glycosyltransferase family 4 protein [Thermoleophilaceae bacterium]
MRILIFHGYLLRGTGSNIYNASLVRAFARLGHQVELLCQDRAAGELGLPDAVNVTVPDIHGVLPVYVADRYEGFDAVPYPQLDDEAVEHYVAANVRAVREVAERTKPDVALANHLVMGPAILARALGGSTPYAVKIHGSALEYTVRPHRERFLPYAHEGLRGASGVLVGSRHTAESLWEVMDEPGLPERTRLGPPGVDVHSFHPRSVEDATSGLRHLAERVESGAAADWGGEADAANVLAALDPSQDRIVSYVGKLIVSKGVDLLLAAWPLVVARVPDARLVIVGFGTYREALSRFVEALRNADLATLRDIAARGRELEGGPPGRLGYLEAFLDRVDDEWLRTAPAAAERVRFTGRLEHDDLPDLLPACEAQVMASTFPEAFGMVAAEAAACGALPLSAGHSGMAEVTATLAPALPPELRRLLSFQVGPGAVEEIAGKLVDWLTLGEGQRAAAREALAAEARRRYGWEGVAEGVIAAAQGRLDELQSPAPPADSVPDP